MARRHANTVGIKNGVAKSIYDALFDAILQQFSGQQILDMSQERYGAQPATTAKAMGALTKLDISNNHVDEACHLLTGLCNTKGIELRA